MPSTSVQARSSDDDVLLSTAHPFSNHHETATVSAQLRAPTRALLPRAAEAQIASINAATPTPCPKKPVVHLPNSDIDIYGVASVDRSYSTSSVPAHPAPPLTAARSSPYEPA
jgi:hypothetical protein